MKLLMLQGLPGSGKSTLAQGLGGYRDEIWVRVNKDDIRAELAETGWTWSPEREADVIRIRDEKISTALSQGFNVVSDDTNFGRKHKVTLAALAAKYGATFEIKKLDTPIDVCIARDAQRTGKAHVGEAVIRRMASQYNLVPAEPDDIVLARMVPVSDTPKNYRAIICDLDGTLAIHSGRSPYDTARCGEDLLNHTVAGLLRRYDSHKILFCSGREDTYRPQTAEWLVKHRFGDHILYMRPAGDKRKDFIVKYELFDRWIRPRYKVDFVLDDRDQVVRMWRHIGLTCFQVAPGDF
jgi:predicted kinase